MDFIMDLIDTAAVYLSYLLGKHLKHESTDPDCILVQNSRAN